MHTHLPPSSAVPCSRSRFSVLTRAARALLAVAAAAGSAQATWSIVLIDTRTGEVAVGSATCLFNFDLQANTPVLLPMVGGAAAQSAVDADGTNRVYIRDGLLAGVDPAAILAGLGTFDLSPQSRQYGIADVLGRAGTFTGANANAWAGGVTGSIPQAGGDIIYAIQGNILTGAPVVLLAESAIQTTSGDLAARLMAGMEAARSMGGDGRCSCASGPTACGSPPSTPWALADGILYMLIARDGDREGSSGVYKVRTAGPMAIADFDGDAWVDLVATSTSNVYVAPNITRAGAPMQLGTPISSVVGSGPRGVVARDFNADGRADVAVCNVNNGNAAVLLGKGDGTFEARVNYTVGTQPIAILCANFDADAALDLIVLNSFAGTPSLSFLSGKGDGTFHAATTTALASTPSGIAAGDFDGDGDRDVAVIAAIAKTLTLYLGDGAGGFAAEPSFVLPISANTIDAADMDTDGVDEMIVGASTSPLVLVLRRTGSGFDGTTVSHTGAGSNAVLAADLDGDGKTDIAAAARSPNGLAVFMGDGDGAFAGAPLRLINNVPTKLAAADLDQDGDLDLISSNSGLGAVTITTNLSRELGLPPGQVALASIGCASGDYFMEFNVLAPGPGNADPVFVAQDMYDMWRSDLVDRADAVVSTAALSRSILPSDGSSMATIDITIRDWQGNPVTRELAVTIGHHAPDVRGLNGSDGISQLGTVENLGAGNYRATVRAGVVCGEDRIAITVTDPTALAWMRPVVLMPSPIVELSAAADRDGSGAVDLADYMQFWMDFDASDPAADLTGDGVVDLEDYFAFFNSFDQGCGG